MFGVLFASVSTFFEEVSSSIGKYEVEKKKESIFTMGFLNMLWSVVLLLVVVFWRNSFVFSLASMPTFAARAILEVIQVHVTTLAIVRAERSAFGLLRMETIPLLLLVDIILGYAIGMRQIIGMLLLVFTIFFLFFEKAFKKDGLSLVIFSAFNAVATFSLYKYNITHFNSVEGEQIMMHLITMFYMFAGAFIFADENPLALMKKPVIFVQSAAHGVGNVLFSFAFLFDTASVIVAAKRASSALWSVLLGNIYFGEKHILVKALSLVFFVTGLYLLI